jgi:hypothetical protein
VFFASLLLRIDWWMRRYDMFPNQRTFYFKAKCIIAPVIAVVPMKLKDFATSWSESYHDFKYK